MFAKHGRPNVGLWYPYHISRSLYKRISALETTFDRCTLALVDSLKYIHLLVTDYIYFETKNRVFVWYLLRCNKCTTMYIWNDSAIRLLALIGVRIDRNVNSEWCKMMATEKVFDTASWRTFHCSCNVCGVKASISDLRRDYADGSA
jgi:hypothetical protein